MGMLKGGRVHKHSLNRLTFHPSLQVRWRWLKPAVSVTASQRWQNLDGHATAVTGYFSVLASLQDAAEELAPPCACWR